MKLDFRRHNGIHCDRETAAGKGRGLLRNQLRDSYLLLQGKKAEQLAPQLRAFGYVVVEELIALVDPRTRKVEIVFPRWGAQ
jgi:hypothetical protein